MKSHNPQTLSRTLNRSKILLDNVFSFCLNEFVYMSTTLLSNVFRGFYFYSKMQFFPFFNFGVDAVFLHLWLGLSSLSAFTFFTPESDESFFPSLPLESHFVFKLSKHISLFSDPPSRHRCTQLSETIPLIYCRLFYYVWISCYDEDDLGRPLAQYAIWTGAETRTRSVTKLL